MVLSVLPDLNSQGDDVKSLGISKNDGDGPSGAGGSSKTFLEVSIDFRVWCGKPESRLITSGTRTSRGLTGNVGHSRAARCLPIVEFFVLIQSILLVLSFVNLGQKLIHGEGIPLLLHRKFIHSQLSDSVSFFAATSQYFLYLLTTSCVMFLIDSILRI